MQGKGRFHITIFGPSLSPLSAALAIMVMIFCLILLLVLINVTAQPAQGQTFKVIYSFTGGADGAYPSMVVIDRAGNLYGTTGAGELSQCIVEYSQGCGVVFEITP